MDLYNYFIKDKNKDNTSDNGLNFDNEPREKKILEDKRPFLKKFENKSLSLKDLKKENIRVEPLPLKTQINIIKHFINYINENSKTKINLVKQSLSTLLNVDNKKVYLISFYSDFSDREHIRPFNIFFITFIEDDKNIDIKDKIVYIDILGSKPYSDVSFGSDYELFKGKLVNIFKEKPLKLILNQTRINNYLNKKKYQSLNSTSQRGIPKKVFKTIKSIYQEIPKDEFKIKMGDKCVTDKNNRVILKDCEESKKYRIKDNKILNENNFCLSYHEDRDLTFVPCDTNVDCKEGNIINSCKTIKMRKYGGLEVEKMKKCLNKDLELKECHEVEKISFLK